jgi:hypothetical protein
MLPLNTDLDVMSDQDLSKLAVDVWRRLMDRNQFREPVAIEDTERRTIGILVPVPNSAATVSPEFLAEMNRRIDDPTSRFLTLDEFLDELDRVPSPAGAA